MSVCRGLFEVISQEIQNIYLILKHSFLRPKMINLSWTRSLIIQCHLSFNMICLFSLKEAEKPFCERLHRIRDLMSRSKVSIEEVISELGQYLSPIFLTVCLIMCEKICPFTLFYPSIFLHVFVSAGVPKAATNDYLNN